MTRSAAPSLRRPDTLLSRSMHGVVCHRFEEGLAAGTVSQHPSGCSSIGTAPRHRGSQGSIPLAPRFRLSRIRWVSCWWSRCREGSFYISRRDAFIGDDSDAFGVRIQRRDGSRDRPLLLSLQSFLGVQTLRDVGRAKPHWQPISIFAVSSGTEHRKATIPFTERYLLPWPARSIPFVASDNDRRTEKARLTKSRWGKGARSALSLVRTARARPRPVPIALLPCNRLVTSPRL